jgi:hypothetical protein
MGSAAPVAADFGGTAVGATAPLEAGASAAIPNPSMGFAGGFPASGDVLTASAPSILPGGTDALTYGFSPTDPATMGWVSGMLPAYGAAPAATTAPPTAQQGLDYIYSQPGLGPYDPTTAQAQAAWEDAQKVGTYTPKPPAPQPGFFDAATQGLQSVEQSPWTRLGLAAAPLAVGLSGIGTKLPASAQQAQANYAALAAQGANLNPSQQAVLGQMRQNLTNQWKQTLYNMGVQAGKGGVPQSTQWPQIAGMIDQQISAAAQKMIQQNIQNALQGNAGLVQLATLQMQEDRNFQQTLQNATRALGLAAGLGGTTRTVTTTTTPTAA